jgi:hypothetical protein
MERIVLVGFLPNNNWHSCPNHHFGCGNSLGLNREDLGIGVHLRLRSFVRHKLACYTMNKDGSDGCRVCFTAREYAVGDNDLQLDGAVVKITDVFTAEHENSTMRWLFFHNRGYTYAVVLFYSK